MGTGWAFADFIYSSLLIAGQMREERSSIFIFPCEQLLKVQG